MEELLPFSDIQKIIFTQKKISIPIDLRPMYKISLILIMLKVNGYSNRLSFLQLQYLNWLIKHKKKVENLNLSFDKLPFDVIRIDPFLNIAIDYAIGDKLIQVAKNGKFELTNKALVFVNKIINEKLLLEDFKVLKNIGARRIADSKIKNMLEGK